MSTGKADVTLLPCYCLNQGDYTQPLPEHYRNCAKELELKPKTKNQEHKTRTKNQEPDGI
ncbi:hypothetical protein GCM10007086_06520 [Photobacterium aphoticum]|nr:hypothetical protein GCM10007086_06520 [Photobacterium aphoticum]